MPAVKVITIVAQITLSLMTILLFSCSEKPADIINPEPKKIKERTLTIAILPEQNVFEQKKKYKPLAEYLSNALDVNVKIKLLDSYGSIYDEIRNRTIDGAFFGSFNYVLIKARADIEPLARPVETGDISVYTGIIFTRKDRKITGNVDSWKGRNIALVHEVTTAGYVFPRWYLKKYGINDFERHFGKIVFTGSHDAAILSVFKGQTDLGAAKDLIFRKLLSENPAIKNEMIILAESTAVPSNSLCVRSSLDRETKEALKKTLLSLHETKGGNNALQALNAVKFKETKDSEFDTLRVMAIDLGIDIRTYPFRYRR